MFNIVYYVSILGGYEEYSISKAGEKLGKGWKVFDNFDTLEDAADELRNLKSFSFGGFGIESFCIV